LYKIATKFGYNTTTENLSRLCKYFECELKDVAEFVPDSETVAPVRSKIKPKASAEIGTTHKNVPKGKSG
jgi:putative transcriptional regulator